MSPDAPDAPNVGEASDPPEGGPSPVAVRSRGRPRCDRIDETRSRDGGRDIQVHLSWPDARQTQGSASSVGLPEAEIRSAAEATLDAILGHPAVDRGLTLRGARAVRAFDHVVVIVAVDRSRPPDGRPLVGSVATSRAERIRGAVLATLDAVNRIIERDFDPATTPT